MKKNGTRKKEEWEQKTGVFLSLMCLKEQLKHTRIKKNYEFYSNKSLANFSICSFRSFVSALPIRYVPFSKMMISPACTFTGSFFKGMSAVDLSSFSQTAISPSIRSTMYFLLNPVNSTTKKHY
jgi:hypothetical protein